MIVQIFGPPGSGKSTLLVYFALEALQGHSLSIGHFSYKTNIGDFAPYDRVYSNLEIPGTYKLDVNTLGLQNFENCLILIDEVMLDFDCRDYKSLAKHTIRFLATHRHYRTDICICSQGFSDADKKFRTLTEKLLLVRKVGDFSCVALIDKDTDALNGNIDDVYTKAPPLSRTWFYRPRYFQAFDSFERVPLRPNTAKPWNPPDCSSPGLLRCALCGSRFQCCVYVSPVRRAVAAVAAVWPFRRAAATTNSGRINYDFVGQVENGMPEWFFCECPLELHIDDLRPVSCGGLFDTGKPLLRVYDASSKPDFSQYEKPRFLAKVSPLKSGIACNIDAVSLYVPYSMEFLPPT